VEVAGLDTACWCSAGRGVRQCLDLKSGRPASCTSWGHEQKHYTSPIVVYGDEALEVPAVHDRYRYCRSPASRNDENVVKVRTVVTSDRSVTAGQTKNEVGVSYGTFHIIVEDGLLVWRMCAKWSCHTWIAVQQCLAKNQIQTISQPPYSPDLAPWNFRPSLDTRLGSKGCCLVSSEEIQQRHSRPYRRWTCRYASRKIRTAEASVNVQKGSTLRVTGLGSEACPQNCEKRLLDSSSLSVSPSGTVGFQWTDFR
jgi:hypothetical protein